MEPDRASELAPLLAQRCALKVVAGKGRTPLLPGQVHVAHVDEIASLLQSITCPTGPRTDPAVPER